MYIISTLEEDKVYIVSEGVRPARFWQYKEVTEGNILFKKRACAIKIHGEYLKKSKMRVSGKKSLKDHFHFECWYVENKSLFRGNVMMG